MTPLIWTIVAAVAVLVIAAGVGLSKRKTIFGVLVDGRGKYSLSRLQILLWTALIIGGYFGIAFPKLEFVDIPAEVLGLLGITLGSTVVSTAIKANQMLAGQTEDEAERSRHIANSTQNEMLRLLGVDDLENLSANEKSMLVKDLSTDEQTELDRELKSKRKPSWMDMFGQEQKGKEDLIDIGKLQMFAWMIVGLVIYGAMLVKQLTLPPVQVQQLTELPNISGTILALMGISQTAYLGMKLPSQTPTA